MESISQFFAADFVWSIFKQSFRLFEDLTLTLSQLCSLWLKNAVHGQFLNCSVVALKDCLEISRISECLPSLWLGPLSSTTQTKRLDRRITSAALSFAQLTLVFLVRSDFARRPSLTHTLILNFRSSPGTLGTFPWFDLSLRLSWPSSVSCFLPFAHLLQSWLVVSTYAHGIASSSQHSCLSTSEQPFDRSLMAYRRSSLLGDHFSIRIPFVSAN